MTMREAIKKTLALHQMVVDGEYDHYGHAKKYSNNSECHLCEFSRKKIMNSEIKFFPCYVCPWMIFENIECDDKLYFDSPASILRLNRWLSLLDKEEQNEKQN